MSRRKIRVERERLLRSSERILEVAPGEFRISEGDIGAGIFRIEHDHLPRQLLGTFYDSRKSIVEIGVGESLIRARECRIKRDRPLKKFAGALVFRGAALVIMP